MSKKKHPEHVNHERWLVSYADFITLLFAFFVVLFASGQSDKHKKEKMAASMQAAFSQIGIFDQHAKQPSLDNTTGPSGNPAPIALAVPTEESLNAEVKHKLEAAVAAAASDTPTPATKAHGAQTASSQQNPAQQNPAQQDSKLDVSVHSSAEGVVVSLHEGGFFASGSADLRPSALPTLRALAATLPLGALRVEGHTDNLPMHSTLYASNWELSTARAAAIARFLLEHSARDPALMSIAGYAEFHPATTNATPEGRAANRRVDLVLLQPSATPATRSTAEPGAAPTATASR